MSPPDPSWTLAALRTHVQAAIELELFTIPAYLTAYFSVRQGASTAADTAADALLTILDQEMLHLELGCNLSNALGQAPRLTGRAAPSFPGLVPSHRAPLRITLGAATDAQIRAFMTIELPVGRDPYSRPDLPPQRVYSTIGEFYHSLRFGLGQVFCPGGEPWPAFAGPQIQGTFDDDHFAITDLASATRALELIVLQGEGASLDNPVENHRELAHYAQLSALLGTLGPADLRPMRPSTAGLAHAARGAALLDFFDACYSHLLRLLEGAFTGRGKIGPAVGLMSQAITPIAYHVVDAPYLERDDGADTGETLTPRFRYVTTTPQQAFDALDPEDRGASNIQEAASALRLTLG